MRSAARTSSALLQHSIGIYRGSRRLRAPPPHRAPKSTDRGQPQYNYAAVAGPAARGEAIQWSQSRALTPATAALGQRQPIMESLLCGLGLGSEPTAEERQQASSSSWTALSYITGTTSDEPASPSISRGYDWPEPPPSSPPRQGPWPIEARAPSPAAAAWAPDNLPARSSAAPAASGTASPPSSPTTAPRTFLVAATVRSPSDPRGRGTPMRRRPPSPVVNVRSAERRFLDEFLVMLADGFKMRKHGRRSRAA